MNILSTINLKRAVLALALVALVATAGFLSTRAFFSDTETSAANVFSAGSLNLKVGINAPGSQWPTVAPRDNNNQQLFAIGGLIPGQVGTGELRLLSEGDDAWACVAAEITKTPENTRLPQEASAGDISAGSNSGELAGYMQVALWEANGLSNADGVVGTNEKETLQVMSLEDFASGEFFTLQDSSANGGDNPLEKGDEYRHEFAYCFGEFSNVAAVQANGGTLECNGAAASNVAQTDGVELALEFYAEQRTNNAGFTCSAVADLVIEQADLATGDRADEFFTNNWFFYNDSNDTIMTENEFGPTSNSITTGPDGVEAARMTLHSDDARYNIATYRFRNLKLADLTELSYRIYDDSVSSQTPFIHFNVDFNDSDTWQGRLVQVPTVTADTWTTVDALAGTWTKTSGNWPDGVTSDGTLTGDTPRTLAEIIADYPDVQLRNTDAFFGVRVGHPGPSGEMGWVDYINVNGKVFNFGN